MINLRGHSGGAIGSDHQWEAIGREIIKDPNTLNFIHYYHGARTPYGNRPVTEEEYAKGVAAVHRANKTLNRRVNYYMSLLARNYLPVKEATAVFAIVASASERIIDGGTAWGLQMAADEGKPRYIFDQGVNLWKEWESGWGWCKCECPILTTEFAAIGTRQINDRGKAAIAEIYRKTLRKWGLK